ncbi:MAG: RNA polymerase sigma factor [Lewinellaceae bacterium]|nr:RNA polymerase sigma factor [Lewinellaceae bacterium]
MAATLSDDLLIQQALAGRQSAYSMLVKRYEQYVFTLVLRMVKNREDAHEVAQDVFLKAFRYLKDFRGDSKFTTWLYKIVYTTAVNHLRKKTPEILSMDDGERPIHAAQEWSPDASSQMEIQDQNRALHHAIKQLNHDDATVITLFYLYEHNLDEICQIMDLSLSNAKTKLCRARQRLKNIVADQYQELMSI